MNPPEKDLLFKEMGFPPEQGQLSSAVIYGVARTYSILYRELIQIYKDYGLTPASFNLLMLLQQGTDSERSTQQAMGERLAVSASDMTGLIDRLERKGLVQRRPGSNRRSKLLRITEKGRRLLETIWPHHVEKVKQLNGEIDARDADTLLRVLRQLREAAQH